MITFRDQYADFWTDPSQPRPAITRDYYGLSTDTKPTERVCNASTFYEMDTKKLYMFDAQNGVWLEQ